MKKSFFFITAIAVMAIISCSTNSDSLTTETVETSLFSPKVTAKPTTDKSLNLEGAIGKIDNNGNNIITIDITPLKANWEGYLADNGIKTSLVDFEILNVTDEDDPETTHYILTAYAADLGTQVAMIATYDTTSNTFKIPKGLEGSAGGAGTVTTYTCSGCNACRISIKRFPSGRIMQVNCKPGCIAPSKCTKTETVTITEK